MTAYAPSLHRWMRLTIPLLALGVAAGCALLPGPFRDTSPEPAQTLFSAGDGGYLAFRSPALVVTADGHTLAFCQGRRTSRSDRGEMDFVLRRSINNGADWGPIERVLVAEAMDGDTLGPPCPVVDAITGTIWLAFSRANTRLYVMDSQNNGASWSEPREITKWVKKSDWDWYGAGPGAGLQMDQGEYQGRLIIPCDHSEILEGRRQQVAHVIYSDDHGETWELGGSVSPYTDEPQVAQLTPDRLGINMRNFRGQSSDAMSALAGLRATAWSRDGGMSWLDLDFHPQLIDPICQASFIRYSWPGWRTPGRLLFSNPASATDRARLAVRVSEDDGQTWPHGRIIHAGPAAGSSLAVLPDGRVGVLYEGGDRNAYEHLLFRRLDLSWLLHGQVEPVLEPLPEPDAEAEDRPDPDAPDTSDLP